MEVGRRHATFEDGDLQHRFLVGCQLRRVEPYLIVARPQLDLIRCGKSLPGGRHNLRLSAPDLDVEAEHLLPEPLRDRIGKDVVGTWPRKLHLGSKDAIRRSSLYVLMNQRGEAAIHGQYVELLGKLFSKFGDLGTFGSVGEYDRQIGCQRGGSVTSIRPGHMRLGSCQCEASGNWFLRLRRGNNCEQGADDEWLQQIVHLFLLGLLVRTC